MQRALTAMAALVFAACGDAPEPQPDTRPPQIVSTVPADGASNVALNTVIEIQFDEAVDNHSISNDVFYLELGGQPRYGKVSYDLASFRATLALVGDLQAASTYQGVLGPGIKDLAGNRRSQPHRWTFSTGN